MFKNINFLVIALFIVASCSNSAVDLSSMKAKGGVKYGGNFCFMSLEKISSLFPLANSDIYNQRLTSQLFETLLKNDFKNNKVIPNLAESYKISPDAKKFTIKIRKGVFFHDDECFSGGKGRELTADDIKYMLDFACSGMKINKMSWMLIDKIKGANQFNKTTKLSLKEGGVSGVKVVDDQTITIELVDPFVSFEKILTHSSLSIFPREAFEMYKGEIKKHPIGTGAFKLGVWDNNHVELLRNNNYWRKDHFGNQLPFLEKLTMTYVKDKKSELLAFRKKEIDLVLEIPVDDIENVLGSLKEAQAGKTVKHRIDSKTSLSTTYFGFAHDSEPFNKKEVREAFNIAIDRSAIIDNYLNGEGYAALNGFVPAIEGYTSDRVKGFKYNPAQAKQLLAKAGYPNGKNFPSIDLYVNTIYGSSIYMLAKGVVDHLKANLNVSVKIKLCTIEERDKAILSKAAKFWRGGWIADYPDPENFLNIFSSDHVLRNANSMNQMKYKSAEFDRLLGMSMKERNSNIRNEFFVKCDQMIIDDAVVLPLLNDDFITMINSKIKNFETNSMEGIDFTSVFIKEPKK